MKLITPLLTGPRTGRTIIFFPHAGGPPRFFTHLAAAMPQHQVFGVTYPGRDHLVDATPVTDIARLSALVADELMAQYSIDDTPLILVGHSLGAFVAYETAAALSALAASPRTIVVVSGQNPPLPHRLARSMMPGNGTDDDIVADVLRQNPDSAPIWENPELRSFFLPAVRSDYEMLSTYRPSRIRVEEVRVIVGDQDTEVDASLMPEWQEVSRRDIEVVVARGGHFYLASPDVQLAHELLRITTLTSTEGA